VTERDAYGGVLILGGGFAGGYVARLLGERGATIVSPENFMLYTPLLPEAASGTLEPRHAVVPLRVMCQHAEGPGRLTTICALAAVGLVHGRHPESCVASTTDSVKDPATASTSMTTTLQPLRPAP